MIPEMQTSNRDFNYRSYISDFKYIVKKNGVLNLWRGNLMNIARIFPYSAIVTDLSSRILLFSTFSDIDSISQMRRQRVRK